MRKPEARDSLRVTERDFFLFGYVFFLTDHKDQLRKEGANRFHSPGEHLVLCRGGRGCRWLHLSWQPGSKGTGTPIHSRQLSEVSCQSKVTRPERGKAGSRTRLQCRGPSHESTSPALLVLSLAEMPLTSILPVAPRSPTSRSSGVGCLNVTCRMRPRPGAERVCRLGRGPASFLEGVRREYFQLRGSHVSPAMYSARLLRREAYTVRRRAGVPIKLYLRTLKLEFHLISARHKMAFFF